MIKAFWRHREKQGRLGKELDQNSDNVYIIHVLLMEALALTMRDLAILSLRKIFGWHLNVCSQ